MHAQEQGARPTPNEITIIVIMHAKIVNAAVIITVMPPIMVIIGVRKSLADLHIEG